MENEECGKMQSVKNGECGKRGVQLRRSENEKV